MAVDLRRLRDGLAALGVRGHRSPPPAWRGPDSRRQPHRPSRAISPAFGGYDFVMEAYHLAMKNDYRFGTYGDAMLIV